MPVLPPAERLAGVHDVMAAEMLSAAAQTNAGARQLVDDLNDTLTTAYIHRNRSRALHNSAVKATLAGAHDVAALVGRFAAEEDEAADEYEAVASSCVRGMHGFGYMSPAEVRFIQRKKFEEGMSTGQAEEVFSKLLSSLYDSATNYGLDADGFGAEDSQNPDAEPDEMDDGAIEMFGAVAEALGAYYPIVFGSGSYAAFHGVYGASLEKLKNRRNRVKNRLKKNMEKLEALEAEGKSGLRVKWFRRRIEKLEQRLEKLNKKIKDLAGTKEKVDDSEADAEDLEAAETSAAKAAADAGKDDSEIDDIESELSELDKEDSEEDEGDEDEEESDDYGLIAEIDVFGASPKREERLEKRVVRLRARLDKLTSRRRGLLKNARIRRIKKRLDKLEAKLDDVRDEAAVSSSQRTSSSTPSYTASLTSPVLSAYKPEEYLASFKGSLNAAPEIANRQPFVQFFRREAESQGSFNVDPAVMATENRGFFARLGSWFQENLIEPVEGLFAPERVQKRRERREARRQAARRFIKTQAETLKAKRVASRTARREAAERYDLEGHKKALSDVRKHIQKKGRDARKSVTAKAPSAQTDLRMVPDGTYQDEGYVYLVKDGRPFLLKNKKSNKSYAPGTRPIPKVEEALANIRARATRIA